MSRRECLLEKPRRTSSELLEAARIILSGCEELIPGRLAATVTLRRDQERWGEGGEEEPV